MGLGTSTSKIYLGIVDGKIVQRVTAETPNAESRVIASGSSAGKVVYELRYSFITALLTGISIKKGEIAGKATKEWILDLVDGDDSYQLQMMYDSRYATSFFNALANPFVDFQKPIKITPWMKVVDNKKKISCYLSQDGESLDWFFTRDNPNGLPELKEVTFNGETKWDSYDRMQFFEHYIETKIKPKLPKGNIAQSAPASSATANTAPAFASSNPVDNNRSYGVDALPAEDDLPF